MSYQQGPTFLIGSYIDSFHSTHHIHSDGWVERVDASRRRNTNDLKYHLKWDIEHNCLLYKYPHQDKYSSLSSSSGHEFCRAMTEIWVAFMNQQVEDALIHGK